MSFSPSLSSRPLRVLVIGASGLVGHALLQRLGDDAVGTYNSHPFPGGIAFDALEDRIERVVPLDEFTHAVVLSGLINPAACAADPQASRRLNVTAVGTILRSLAASGVVPVYTSSEVVFDGRKGSYVESDEPNPLFLYAQQKREVERLLDDIGGSHLVVRLARVFGSDPNDGTLFTDLLAQVRGSGRIRCAFDQIFSPLHADEAAEAIARLVERGCQGLFHAAGPRAIDRCEALSLVLRAFRHRGGVFNGSVETVSISELPTGEPRPRDVSLDTRRLVEATALRMRDPADWCAEIVDHVLATGASGKYPA